MIKNNNIEVQLLPISKLKHWFDKRFLSIPKLQREFVWNSKKAAELMDSIYKTYPIGTILIWKVEKNKQFELNSHPNALPPFKSKGNKYIYFIIDGQQRLSVIYRILKGDGIKNDKNEEINFSNIFFILGKDEKKFKYLKNEYQSTACVTQILSDNWKNKFHGSNMNEINQLKKCRDKIYNYKIPLIIVTGFDLEEIKQTFIRINSLGTPISSADQAFTLASSFNLKDRIKSIYESFSENYKNLSKEIILRTIVLIWESEIKKKNKESIQFGMEQINALSNKLDKSKEAQSKFNRIWKKLQFSFSHAIDYLSDEYQVKYFNDLPSENMLIQLSAFYYYNGNAQPNPYERNQIKKWFWYSGILSRYSGRGYSKNIINDFIYFRKLALGRHLSYQIKEKIPKSVIYGSDYRKSASLNKAYFIMLGLNGPKYLDGGGNIPLTACALHNKKNKHHIFPRDYLNKKEISPSRINSLANICFLVFSDNQHAKNKPPVKYLAEFKKQQFYGSFLRSHLIPATGESGVYGLNKSDYNKFLSNRTNIIAKKFEKFAGIKMFEN